MTSPMKVCRVCKVELPTENFGVDMCKKDGLRSYCRECDRKLARERGERTKSRPKKYVEEKYCHRCKTVKPRGMFYQSNRILDGLYIYCKDCTSAVNKVSRTKLKEKAPTVEHKSCPTCGVDKPMSEYYLAPKNTDGLSWECGVCTRKRTSGWIKRNPEWKKEIDKRKNRQWRMDGRARLQGQRNRERHPDTPRKWREKNREKLRGYFKELARLRRKNPEKVKMYSEASRRWSKKHPDKNRIKSHKYNTRKHTLPFEFTEDDYIDTMVMFNHECGFCGGGGKLTLEHVVPLSRKDVENPGTVRENIMPLCKSCNSSKNKKLLDEYFADMSIVRDPIKKHMEEMCMGKEQFIIEIEYKLDMLRKQKEYEQY